MVEQMKTVCLCLLSLAMVPNTVYATVNGGVLIQAGQQNGACRGVVIDATGEAVVGASVVVKGTTNGTITGIDGDFSLTGVKKGDVIQISFIGYQRQEVVWNETSLKIVLKDNSRALDEVVVTGYGGSQKRATLTTAISKMDNSVLKNSAFSNAGQALQGSVTGLRVVNTSGQPGTAPNIVLRGGATITGSNNNALIIVDGVVRNSMSDVNPQDIESVQVLKDAASTAIYGARANGGVILIETKSGKEGKTSINYNFKYGKNFSRKGYSFLNAHDYIYYNRLGVRRTNEAVSAYNSRGYSVDGQMGYGIGNTNFDIRYLNSSTAHLQNEGWSVMDDPYNSGRQILYKDYSGILDDEVFNNSASVQEHYLNLSGGNDKSTFGISFGYYDEDGQVKSTGFRRFTGNLVGSYKVLPILLVKGSANYIWSTTPQIYSSNYSLFYRTRSQRPTWNPYREDGSPSSGFGTADGNPQYWISKLLRDNSTTRYTLTTGFALDIIKKQLVLNGNISLLNYQYQRETFNKAYQQQNQGSPNTTRASSVELDKYNQLQMNTTLNYTRVFNDVHDVNVMLGGEYYTYNRFILDGSAHGAPTDDIATMNVASAYDGISTYKTAYRILSAFGRAEYNYKTRYLLALTGRYDGISRLKDNRWGFFPGISLGWNVTSEDFWKETKVADVITTLKPRISYGTNGNVNSLGDFTVYGAYGSTLPNYDNATAIVNTNLLNTSLRWEKSKTFEVGLDIGLLNNKVSIVLDYYNRETQDLLTSLALPGYTGFSSITTNLGNLRNSGFEAEVRANIIKTKDFSWDMTANLTTVSNKILKLPKNSNDKNRVGGYEVAAGPAVKNADGTWKYTTKWVSGRQEGGKLGEIVAYKQKRIYRDWDDVRANANMLYDDVGKLYGPGLSSQYSGRAGYKPIEPGDVYWEDMDGDGQITSYDRTVIGNIFPNVTGGFSTTFAYKGISLYARFDYALGHTLYNDLLARSVGQYQGNFNIISEVKKTWSETNPDADLPKFYYADQLAKYNITRSNNGNLVLDNNNSRFYEKADYLACREITLSYSLPKRLLKKAFIRDASVYVTGQNLFYITGYTGVSPEPAVAGTNAMGVDDGRYPTPRTLLFGLSVTF